MTDQSPPNYYYPNKMGRIILMAMEEVLGRNGVNAALNIADLPQFINHYPPNNLDMGLRFDQLSHMQTALERLYGLEGGRGLALRSGRVCFKYGLREFGPLLGCTDLAFRLLPLSAKLRVGSEIFARTFNEFSDQRVRVEETPETFLWHIERCPVCWQRHADHPVCHLAVGILQEALYWVSGGKFFSVEETNCVAKGDPACTIKIDKQPLE
ncbi:MAG: 4-vinyl reductase [Chloroflexota bacterium]|nr:MAG: 4-vinyl reductase [Chloroflexota bacterium]